ncbi:MAG: response regulator [Anaerolineales bacterium]|nr:MAG: response regulator [Anaerolineales bacterium]
MAKILVAEDERDIRELIEFALHYNGHEVLTAADGLSAWDLTVAEQPDLVLLDVRMPRMDGYEVCRRIKRSEKLRHIPVAFLSAKGQEAEVQAGLDAGAEEYILKPFSLEQLDQAIARLLND